MDMRKLRLLLVLISLVALAAAPAPVSAERGSWNNWHVHDGGSGTDASGLTHRPFTAIFPEIWPTYASDSSLWAYCTDATDKSLVGGDGGAKQAAGHCQNELYIIHLQAIANESPAPAGWTPLTPDASFDGFTVYYRLTAR
jgi:hypothetical protein